MERLYIIIFFRQLFSSIVAINRSLITTIDSTVNLSFMLFTKNYSLFSCCTHKLFFHSRQQKCQTANGTEKKKHTHFGGPFFLLVGALLVSCSLSCVCCCWLPLARPVSVQFEVCDNCICANITVWHFFGEWQRTENVADKYVCFGGGMNSVFCFSNGSVCTCETLTEMNNGVWLWMNLLAACLNFE